MSNLTLFNNEVEKYKVIKKLLNKIIQEKRKTLNSYPVSFWTGKYAKKSLTLALSAAIKHKEEKSQNTFTTVLYGKGIRWKS